LVEYAKVGNHPVMDRVMEKAYRNTIYCAAGYVQVGGKLSTHYCGNRWCLVCNRVRTARAIEAYKPIVESWQSPYMVTLTLRNCGANDLSTTLGEMVKGFASCVRSVRRTHGLAVTALRKVECTYNIRESTYHPHYHVIIDGREQAELLRDLWLRRFRGRAELVGQDVKLCGEGSLQELFKYFTKLTTQTRTKKGRQAMPVEALHAIFSAMRGRRVWQSCGFTLSKEVEEAIEGGVIEVAEDEVFEQPEDLVLWEWEQEYADWIDLQTGARLSGYVPSGRFRAFVESIRDRSTVNRDGAVMAVSEYQGDGGLSSP
jgi:hypothetical protein